MNIQFKWIAGNSAKNDFHAKQGNIRPKTHKYQTKKGITTNYKNTDKQKTCAPELNQFVVEVNINNYEIIQKENEDTSSVQISNAYEHDDVKQNTQENVSEEIYNFPIKDVPEARQTTFSIENSTPEISRQDKYIYPVIVSIAKKEEDYIEEFIVYHLELGFSHIYLYDNEDLPTYQFLLEKYKDSITFIHLPFNNHHKPVQYVALDDFINRYLHIENITHVAHIDIDEFIVLKKHDNICEFIKEYLVDDCEGIAMNWRLFGSSGRTEKTNEPLTLRFTKCEEKGNIHIKTLFSKKHFQGYSTCHFVNLSQGHIKSTNNHIVSGPFNEHIDFSIIQLNHYKSKTLPEYRYIRTRQRADVIGDIHENVEETFKGCDINEIEELTAYNFYKKRLEKYLKI